MSNEYIEREPITNVTPVVYARWDYQIDGTHFCSDCGTNALYNYEGKEICSNWCPACGCFMTEVRNKDE